MSASERLKALEMTKEAGAAANANSLFLLPSILPQIVAVVEAAERVALAERGELIVTLDNSLAALEEALS